MNTQEQMQSMASELSQLLTEEIDLLHQRRRQFDELYDAILHHDNDAMETLLEEMTDTQQRQIELDTQLQAMRNFFAKLLGCKPHDMKLSSLSEHLGPATASQLEYKRQQIILLAEKLKRKHLDTAILLNECSKVNRMLLKGLMPKQDTVTTYNPYGAQGWRGRGGLVDAEM